MVEQPSASKATRRGVLRTGGLGAMLLGAGGTPALAQGATSGLHPGRSPVDVLVIGAGFSGLSAAHQLVGAGKSVVVLEARERVGGRTKPAQLAGHTIDVGGMWVGPTQTRLIALGEKYGARRFISPAIGSNISFIEGEKLVGKGTRPGFDDATVAEFHRLYGALGQLAETVPPEAPWTAPDADRLDSQTFRAWIEEQTEREDMRRNLDRLSAALLTTDSSTISMLYLLFYIRSGDSLSSLVSVGDGAQKWLYHGGVHQIATKMAEELGDRIVLNTPVQHIRQDAGGVEVLTENGSWRARRVIVALPPAMCARIRFSPMLPTTRDKLQQRYPMGSTIKFWVAYAKPFWRERGLNGYVYFDRSELTACLDGTPEGSKEGLLVGFIEASRAVQWSARTMAERRALVLGELVRAYGPEAGEAIDYIDNDWSQEEWSHGCYAGNATPGTLSTLGTALRQPVGRIHWAGTETSPHWAGYIEGAIRAGERAAAEAAAAL